MKYKKVIISLFLLLRVPTLTASSAENVVYVREQLKKIPTQDKRALTLFFETLLADNFAYTLFGSKPVSEEDYNQGLNFHRKKSWLATGKKTWERYSSLFPSSRYVFKYESDKWRQSIILINKQAFLDVVQEYLPLFQSILGTDISPKKLLDKIQLDPYEKTLNHPVLIGLLYGYGYKNALCFVKPTLTDQIIKWFRPPVYFYDEDTSLEIYKDPIHYFKNQPLEVPEDLAVLLQKTSNPAVSISDMYSVDDLALFPLPTFQVDDDNLTDANELFEKYKITRHAIMTAYNGQDFLEVTLCKLIEN